MNIVELLEKLVIGTDIKLFNRIISERIKITKELLLSKGEEYAGYRKDRFANFNASALDKGETTEKALYGMLIKHLCSVKFMIEDLENGIEHPLKNWKEKLGDIITYYHLLEVVVTMRKESKHEQN